MTPASGAPEVLHRAALGRLRAVFTGSKGGVSRGAFAEGNLAVHVGDDPAAVEANRRALSLALGIRERWAEADQVHGASVVEAAVGNCGEADAILLSAGELPAAIFVADCLPVLLATADGAAAAVVHAGWRGLVAGVIEEAGAAVRRAADSPPATALIGPGIGPCCYEVGAEVASAFEDRFGASVAGRRTDGTTRLDLKAAARLALAGIGVSRVLELGPCTADSPGLFSYRGDGPVTGRQALVAWIADG